MDQSISEFLAREGLGSGVALDGAAEAAKTQVGHHAVGDVVARGGMGAILSARDQNIRRRVAMKVLLDRDPARKEQLVRFIEEAQVTGQLEHPNIVPVHELGIDAENNPYYTMKFIQGGSLKDILSRLRDGDAATLAKYPLPKLLAIFLKACDAMAFAHSKGVIHRDLKPENLMVGDYGEVLVVDWGLAKVVGVGRPAGPLPQSQISDLKSQISNAISSARQEGGACVTMDGQVLGTPQYMAPEQATGQIDKLDARTDVYALGGILYSLLTLHPPVEGDTLYRVLLKVSQGEITHPSLYNPGQSLGVARASGAEGPGLQTQLRRQVAAQVRKQVGADQKPKVESPKPMLHLPGGRVPEPLAAVALKALALDPAARYQTVAELQAEVEAYLGGYATQAEDASLWRQLGLLVKRNKGIFTTAAAGVLVVVLTVGFAFIGVNRQKAAAIVAKTEAVQQRDRAEQTLVRLRDTAPTFIAQAQAGIEKHEFPAALKNVEAALDLMPENAGYHELRGNLLQSLLRLEEAAAAYEQCLKLDPRCRSAKVNLALCRELARLGGANKGAEPALRQMLIVQLTAQGRLAEAAGLARGAQFGKTGIWDTWTPLFNRSGLAATLTQQADGALALTAKPDLEDLGPLRKLAGMPLASVSLTGSKVVDLAPLTGFRLVSLSVALTGVMDLTPLKGMPLTTLMVHATPVADLTPLRGMPLTTLMVHATPVADLTPLRGMPLTSLTVNNTRVTDLTPLRGMPLTSLDMHGAKVTDLAPLKGMPLTSLIMYDTKAADLAPLKGMPLTLLNLAAAPVSDLSALTGMPLTDLGIYNTAVKELTPLKGMPLTKLALYNTLVSDLAPLKGMPLTTLAVHNTRVADLAPLNGMPLTWLWMHDTLVTDLTPLAGMKLTQVSLTPERIERGMEVLRAMPTLQKMGTTTFGLRPAAEFWKEWDARKK